MACLTAFTACRPSVKVHNPNIGNLWVGRPKFVSYTLSSRIALQLLAIFVVSGVRRLDTNADIDYLRTFAFDDLFSLVLFCEAGKI